MTYHTPSSAVKAQLDIKKSEFISYAFPVNDREQAMAHVDNLRQQYPDARHHCWAYIIGDPNNTTSAGFDDDGEPSGTAGRPILNVLQHKAIGNVIIIVVRYFGGIKLGAGGLTRAYSGAAQSVVEVMTLTPYVPTSQIRLQTNYASEAQMRYLLDAAHAQITDVAYTEGVLLTATLATHQIAPLVDKLGVDGKLVDL